MHGGPRQLRQVVAEDLDQLHEAYPAGGLRRQLIERPTTLLALQQRIVDVVRVVFDGGGRSFGGTAAMVFVVLMVVVLMTPTNRDAR